MNFQDLKKIENYQLYLDVSIKKADMKANLLRQSIKLKTVSKLIKSRRIEIDRLKIIKETICDKLRDIYTKFPSVDGLSEFYNELIKLNIDVDELKKALGSISWAEKQIARLASKSIGRIKSEEDVSLITKISSSTIGRIASVLKQIQPFLENAESARKIMKTFPAIKTSLFTIAIAGFPNVGKSTLLSKLTNATPDIQNYSFTTKKLNTGYFIRNAQKYQIIDTPGTLARFNKMNPIEKQAVLAMKYAAHILIFIYDLSDSTYTIEDQNKLFEQIKEFDKPVLVYLSKTDIIEKEKITRFVSEYKKIVILNEVEDLIKEMVKLKKEIFDEYIK